MHRARHATRLDSPTPRLRRAHLFGLAGAGLLVGLLTMTQGDDANANRGPLLTDRPELTANATPNTAVQHVALPAATDGTAQETENHSGNDTVVRSIQLPGSNTLKSNAAGATVTDVDYTVPPRPAPTIPGTGRVKPTPATASIKTAPTYKAPTTNPASLGGWDTLTVKNGDNLSTLFQRAGLSGRDVYEITQAGKDGKALKKLFVGEKLGFLIDSGELQQVRRIKSPLETIYFRRTEKGFASETVVREPEIRLAYKSAIIKDSLYLASARANIPQNLIMTMANIFGGVIDFVYDVRKGDQFVVVYEELFLDDEKFDEGNILAAQFVNRGDSYNAYRYEDSGGGAGYYNEDGVSMRKAFLRAPLDFTRISSGFNLKRLHPVTKNVRPHRGTDYAAPTGTPVFSTGDGRVVASSHSKANGKFVFIRHGEAYTTKYLHLSKRAVRNGQKVKQGQIIGHVGCTGLCTGPHLHYEFLVNGVHRNPRTILKKLPKAKSIDSHYKQDFLTAIKPLQLQIASYSAGNLNLASAASN